MHKQYKGRSLSINACHCLSSILELSLEKKSGGISLHNNLSVLTSSYDIIVAILCIHTIINVSIPQKLAMLPSHALDLVAMANVIGSELSELFLDISCLDSKIGESLIH